MTSYTRLSLLAALLVPLVSDSMFGQWSTSLNAAVPGNFVGTTNSEDLTLRTFGADRIRIEDTTGFVRIGTTTPSITPARRLHLFYASTTPQLRLEDPSGFWDIRGGDNLHITDDNGVDWLKCDAVSGVLKVSANPCPTVFTPLKSSTTYLNRSSLSRSRFASERDTKCAPISNSFTTARVVSNTWSWV